MKNYEGQTSFVTDAVSEFAVSNFVILYSITSSLGPATLWIEQMQLTTHYQMLNTNYPANLNLFNRHLLKVVNFDAIDPSYSTDLVFNYQEFHTESYIR